VSESTEQIYALLVDANPVMDVDSVPTTLTEKPHLRVIDTRRDDMDTQTRPRRIGEEPPAAQRRWIPAVAAASIVAVVGAIALAVTLAGDSNPVANAPEDVARAAIADWTIGDVDSFFGHFAEDGTIDDLPVTDGGLRLDLAFYMGLQQVPTISECSPSGESGVRCATTTTDAVSRSLGIETRIDWEFQIVDGEISSLFFDFPSGQGEDIFDVVGDFVRWIIANHGDVFDDALRATPDRCTPTDYNFYGTWCASARAATEMLRLAPEYVASR
jgi:hypothetical protein